MNWPFLALALVCAGFVQGMTGFGFGLVSMSLMPLVIGVKQAAAISTVFSFLATVTTFIRHYREYNWRLGLTFLVTVCVGVPIGVYFLDRAGLRSHLAGPSRVDQSSSKAHAAGHFCVYRAGGPVLSFSALNRSPAMCEILMNDLGRSVSGS